MRRVLLLFIIVISLNLNVTRSQTMVVTTPQHTNVVLEEYTGIHCGYCPDGHVRAEALADANPGRVVLVNVHAGGYAVPSAGEPDFRTAFGDNLANEMGVSGYPSGTINRKIFSEIGSIPAMSRSAWAYAAHQLFPTQSPVNVAFSTVFDTTTRELSVMVELYYTQNSTVNSNYLQVALLENHVFGYQSDYANGTQYNYDHKHILRHLLTGQWGLEISTTTQGSVFNDTIIYTVPVDYDISNCDVAVYVSEDHFNIYTGVQAIADGGSHDGSTSIYSGTLSVVGDNVAEGSVGNETQFTASMESSLPGDEEFLITLSSDNAPADWSAVFSVGGTDYTAPTAISFSNYVPEDVIVKITPGASVAFATYTLEFQSVTYPTAPLKIQQFHVIKGITDLIVNSTGSWGDGNTYDFDQDYIDGLDYAGNQSYALINGLVFAKAEAANALSGVNNIFMNVGWRFPSFSDDQANALMNFMDNGGNVFFAGQDIAWDIASGDGYGTTTTATLFTNYMHASYVSDGNTANSQLTAVTNDPVFGSLNSSAINDLFSGNFYPDQVNAIGGAEAIFNYNSQASKVAGVRYEDATYKMVYLCIDLAMVADASVRKEIIKITHDYFYGPTSADEISLEDEITIYPNPSSGIITIDIESGDDQHYLIEIIEITGRTVHEVRIDKNETFTRTIDLSNLVSGSYFMIFRSDKGVQMRQFEIVK